MAYSLDRDIVAALLVIVDAVRDGRLGTRALDEVSRRLASALHEGDQQ